MLAGVLEAPLQLDRVEKAYVGLLEKDDVKAERDPDGH